MKALTVRQPWAWAIAAGVKTVENRTRGTGYRGPLAIHAGKGWSVRGQRSPMIREDWRELAATSQDAHWWADPIFARGSVIAVAQLVDSHVSEWSALGRRSDRSWFGECCCTHRYAEYSVYVEDERDASRDVVHLVLAEVVQLDDPVPCRGALGLWNLPGDVAEVVEAQLAVVA